MKLIKRKKHDSLFNRIFYQNIVFFFALLFLVAALICSFICAGIYNNEMKLWREKTDREVYAVREQISLAVDKINFIAQNSQIFEPLNAEFVSIADRYDFEQSVRDFFLLVEQEGMEIKIFTENRGAFQSNYIENAGGFGEYSEIKERFGKTTDAILFGGFDDEESCFIFYHKLPLVRDTILRCRVFVRLGEDIIIRKISTGDDTDGIMKQICYDVYGVANVEKGTLLRPVAAVASVTFLVLILVYFCMWLILKSQTNKTLNDIEGFVGGLDAKLIRSDSGCLEPRDGDTAEIKKVKTVIGELVLEIERYIGEKHKNELLNQKLRQELLRSQLNPHTLYNSLSAIRIYAFERHDDYTVELVDNMVKYYHMILRKNMSVSTVGGEIELLRSYVRICEMTHSKRFVFETELDDGAAAVPIPHQLLVPYVENSIMHGFSTGRDDCRISVKAKLAGTRIVISIFDNGFGIPPEKLEKLNYMEDYQLGYGTKNSYMRAKITYRSGFDIKFESELNGFTRVTVTIENFNDVMKNSDNN